MAEDRIGAPENETRTYWAWTELFRTFQVALDPKKLLLAAAGILVMWFGWWVLAIIFFSSRSEPHQGDYDAASYQKAALSEEDARNLALKDYQKAHADYVFLYRLAGPGEPAAADEWRHNTGILRVAPWDENRGPNPFLLVTGGYTSGTRYGRLREWGNVFGWFFTEQMPVLIEPLVKFLHPVVLLVSPYATGWTRIYLLLVVLWTLATWAFFGGAITRLAAVQLAGKDRPGLVETLRFVAARYVSYFAAPLVPLAFIALIVLLTVLYGLIHLIPYLGDLTDGVVWPVLMLLGFGQTVLLIGLVGYPLMYATVSAEGSDTFDALSRSYNYVYQSPWSYLWYSLVAIAYGAVLVFFVGLVGSLVVYLTKWSLSLTPGTDYFVTRRVQNLFTYAPQSFDWRALLAEDPVGLTPPASYNYISAFLVGIWVTLFFLLVIGFGYSYYFTSFTMIYLLMRRKVDDTELDEVYLEEDELDEPLLPPPAPPATVPSSSAGSPVTMVEAPTLRTPTPAASPAAPVTSATDGNPPPPPPMTPPASPATGETSTVNPPPERPGDRTQPAP